MLKSNPQLQPKLSLKFHDLQRLLWSQLYPFQHLPLLDLDHLPTHPKQRKRENKEKEKIEKPALGSGSKRISTENKPPLLLP
jgi:hypothetical protein